MGLRALFLLSQDASSVLEPVKRVVPVAEGFGPRADLAGERGAECRDDGVPAEPRRLGGVATAADRTGRAVAKQFLNGGRSVEAFCRASILSRRKGES